VDNVVRVAFPHFSRIQDDRKAVERTLSQYFVLLLLIAGLWLAVMVVAGPLLVKWIYTEKWSPAIPALIMYSAGVWADMIAWMMVVTLNGLGMVNFTTRFILGRNLAIIMVSVPLVFLIGFNGVPIAYLLMGVLALPFIFLGLERGALRRILRPAAWIVLPTMISIVLGGLTIKLPLPLIPHALLSAAVTCALFALSAWIFSPAQLRHRLLDNLSGRLFRMGFKTKLVR
jgi:PST family polysaccharide transporter